MTKRQPTEKHLNIPVQTRSLQIKSDTVDAEKRTAELVFTTEAKALMGGWFSDPYHEILSMKADHVRLKRMNLGAPVLKDHDRSLTSQIGVVEHAFLEGDKGIANVRFSKRADVDPIFQDVQDKIIKNLSVGYRVYKYQEEGKADDGYAILRAIDWEPMEVSLVTVPADMDSQFRKENCQNENDCVLILKGDSVEPTNNSEISKEASKEGKTMEPTQTAQVDQKAIADSAIQGERKRALEIQKACKAAGLPETDATKFITDGTAIDLVRAQIIDGLSEKADKTPTKSANVVEMGKSSRDFVREGVENALLSRLDSTKNPLNENGKRYRGLTLMEIGKEVLRSSGVNIDGMGKMEVAGAILGMPVNGRAMGTSDFPNIAGNVARARLRQGYTEAPQTFLPITRLTTLPDFKLTSTVSAGVAPALLEVQEDGEITNGTIGEGAESYRLKTYARILPFTRQLIINDSLKAFGDIPAKFGRSARRLESDLVWGEVIANSLMGDGYNVFSSQHGNTQAQVAIAIAGLGTLWQKVAAQTDGVAKLSLKPRYLIVPTALAILAQQYVTAVTPAINGSVNPFAAGGNLSLQVIVEPRLDVAPTVWYLAAGLDEIDMIELAHLEGEEGPVIETKEGFRVDGIEFKCRLDAAAKIVDYHGLAKTLA